MQDVGCLVGDSGCICALQGLLWNGLASRSFISWWLTTGAIRLSSASYNSSCRQTHGLGPRQMDLDTLSGPLQTTSGFIPDLVPDVRAARTTRWSPPHHPLPHRWAFPVFFLVVLHLIWAFPFYPPCCPARRQSAAALEFGGILLLWVLLLLSASPPRAVSQHQPRDLTLGFALDQVFDSRWSGDSALGLKRREGGVDGMGGRGRGFTCVFAPHMLLQQLGLGWLARAGLARLGLPVFRGDDANKSCIFIPCVAMFVM